MKKPGLIIWFCVISIMGLAQSKVQAKPSKGQVKPYKVQVKPYKPLVKPRILVSTDIGGTDPDDNQTMIYLLMHSDLFNIEGLVSSPSYGNGSEKVIFHMINLYAKDYPKLKKHRKGFPTPDYLRSVTKQGRHGTTPYRGFTTATQGSNWIIKCAEKKSSQPLWILVWGGLTDLAQALHDAPNIQNKIRVFWIGGPNKKWSSNSYAYIVKNFPNLLFIECNSSYYGFFVGRNFPDSLTDAAYYPRYINGAGYLGKDFKNYYNGDIKMGDIPTILYLMSGNPDNPMGESWGGSFQKLKQSPRVVYHGTTSLKDTVAFSIILEFHFKGPKLNIPSDSVCFHMVVPYGNSAQVWPGFYLGNGNYAIRYIPKKARILTYRITSGIPELNGLSSELVVTDSWPGKKHATDYKLGNNWYTDRSAKNLYDGKIQGGKTVSKWRTVVLMNWAKRWEWLR